MVGVGFKCILIFIEFCICFFLVCLLGLGRWKGQSLFFIALPIPIAAAANSKIRIKNTEHRTATTRIRGT